MLKTTVKFIFAIYLIFCFVSCIQDEKDNSISDTKKSDNIPYEQESAEDPISIAESMASSDHLAFIPLELSKFQNILNNDDPLSHFYMSYDTQTIDEIEEKLVDALGLTVKCGTPRQPAYYNTINEFDASLMLADYENLNMDFKHHTFLPLEMDGIFDYILNNHLYFFNAEEFDGKTLPYITSWQRITTGKYEFVMIFYDPESDQLLDLGWMICKSVDEYPAPDHPLYGLFQMLENDFISQFDTVAEGGR